MTIFRSDRRRLAGGTSGFVDEGRSADICMDSFRLVGLGSPSPESTRHAGTKRAENASFPGHFASIFDQLLKKVVVFHQEHNLFPPKLASRPIPILPNHESDLSHSQDS